MQSQASDVATYLTQAPAERQAVLQQLRQLCLEVLTGFEEAMEYGMPVYKRGGTAEIAFASQKQYISLYLMKKEVVDRHRPALASCKIGKGCIRFTRPEKIDFTVVRSLLQDSLRSPGSAC